MKAAHPSSHPFSPPRSRRSAAWSRRLVARPGLVQLFAWLVAGSMALAAAPGPGAHASGNGDPAAAEAAALARLDAWGHEYDRALTAHAHALAGEGSDRALVAAAWLLAAGRFHGHGDDGPDAHKQREEWVGAALATGTRDPAVLWLASRSLPGGSAPSPWAAQALVTLSGVDPDNAAVWLALAGPAVADGDRAEAGTALRQAAGAAGFDAYELAVGDLLRQALSGFHPPEIPAAIRQHLAERVGLAPAERLAETLGLALAYSPVLLTSLDVQAAFMAMCRPQEAQDMPPSHRRDCLALAGLIARDAHAVALRLAVAAQGVRLADHEAWTQGTGDAAGNAWRERYRELQWQSEQAHSLLAERAGGLLTDDYFQVLLERGEQAAWLHAFRVHGIPATPPADWQPDGPGSPGRPPAARSG